MSIFDNCFTTDEVEGLLAHNIKELDEELDRGDIDVDCYSETTEQLNDFASERIMEIVLDGVLVE